MSDKSFAKLEAAVNAFPIPISVAGKQLQLRFAFFAIHNIKDSLLSRNHRGELRKNHSSHREQVALPLQHSAELGQVRLQPVLFVVARCRVSQITDHLVDVVFDERDFALGCDLNRSGQVAFGYRRRHISNCAQLRGKVAGELVHVVGQVTPGAGCTGHVRLAAKFSFDPHLPRHRRHLIGERRQCVDHAIDRVSQRCDFAFGCE